MVVVDAARYGMDGAPEQAGEAPTYWGDFALDVDDGALARRQIVAIVEPQGSSPAIGPPLG